MNSANICFTTMHTYYADCKILKEKLRKGKEKGMTQYIRNKILYITISFALSFYTKFSFFFVSLFRRCVYFAIKIERNGKVSARKVRQLKSWKIAFSIAHALCSSFPFLYHSGRLYFVLL